MTMSIHLLKTNFRKAFLLNMVSFDNRLSVSKKPDEEARISVISTIIPTSSIIPLTILKNIIVALRTLDIVLGLWHDLSFIFY